MPAPYGLTATGFSAPSFEEVRDKINRRIWSTISPTLDLSDETFEGQLIAIFTEEIILAWEVAEESHASFDADKAVDAVLDAICLMTGTFRRGPFASTTTLTLTGDDTTPIPTGSIARVPNGPLFQTRADVVLAALPAWTGSTNYPLDTRVTNNGRCYVCIEPGQSASSGGPTTTDDDITDGTVHWRYLGDGDAAADIASQATENGPLAANSGTITEIVTPVGGWKGVINLLDADKGAHQMTNEQLRQLREVELAKPGTGTVDAIEADLLDEGKVPGVKAVTVFVNNSDFTDEDGMPPHSIEALVMGGDDQDIWDTLHRSVGAGIRTHGSEVGTVLDRRGRAHTYRFSRPQQVAIYIDLTVEYDASSAPDDLEDQIKEAIVEWGDSQTNGKNAVASRIAAAAFVHDSVLDVVALIGTSPAPGSSATIEIGNRELATYDTSRITVNVVPGEP